MNEESWDEHDTVQQQNLNKAFEQHTITPVLGIGRSKPAPAPMNKIDAPAPSRWNGGGSTNNDENAKPSFGSRAFGAGGGDRPFRSGNQNDRACYNCNETGHTSRDCPEPRKNNGPNRSGGKPPSFNTFSESDSNSKPAFSSWRAGESNGGSRPAFQSAGSSDTNGGFRANKDGFSSGNRGPAGAPPGGSNCYNCQKPGHISRDCPEPKRPRDAGSSGTGFFSSGARKNDKMTDDIFDQPGADRFGSAQPVERYIPPPPPTTEEDIFGEAVAKGENFERYHRAQVKCTPEGRVRPIELYEEANLPTQILSNIRRAHFEEPTPIQRYTIPSIRQRDDIMACAQTGSGKTAAFLLPILSNLLEFHADELEERAHPPSPLCLVLSPTRELALQTEREARKFAFQTPIIPCSAVGGHDMFAVSDRLREGCHILSATTGRLKDMVDKGRISLQKVKYFVLDEADRMLDTGFEPDIRKLETLGLPPRSERYTSMFSATFPEQVQKLAKHFLRDNYIFLAVGTLGGANEDIAQTIELVPQASKKDRLFQLLEANLKSERCLIFVETKRSADYIGALLSQRQLMSTTMHGDRTQRQRSEAVQQFTNGKCPILVATSVAARGLDFPLIGYVVNYDLPDSTDFYIHRIGRTGRAGHLGRSISFFDPDRDSDRSIAPELVQRLTEAGQEVPDFLKQYAGGSAFSSSAKFNDTRSFAPSRSQGQSVGGSTSAGAATTEDWD